MVDAVSAATTVDSGVPAAKPSFWRRTRRLLRRNSLAFYAFTLLFIFGVILLAPRIFINIPAGHVGVLWLRFFGGTVTDIYYGEGIQAIFPWDEMYIYDARLQNKTRLYDTISSNGLSMQVEIAVRYRINRDAVGWLHKLVGPQYDDILVYPEIGSHARELISRYTPEQLYTETRAFIQAQILERMVIQLGSSLVSQSVRGKLVNVEDVLIRSVKLPARVQGAIERKAEQYQAMLEYDFRIARERKERDRKRIEAEGVRDFQTTVAKSITDEYLRLRGIEATMALATSQNTKVIVIGGRDGLPIILNTEGSKDGKPDAAGGPGAHLATQPNARMMDVTPPNAMLQGQTEANAEPGNAALKAQGSGQQPVAPQQPGASPAAATPGVASDAKPDMAAAPTEDQGQPVQPEGGTARVQPEGGGQTLPEKLLQMLK